MTKTLETPVLVVGGGPIGLTMAIDLAYNGVDCLLIEQGDGVIAHPKIGTIMTRTMEFFRRWGIVDRVRRSGFPDDYQLQILFCTSMTGHLLGRDPFPSTADAPVPEGTPHKRQRCPQMWLDPLLQQAAQEQDRIDLRFHHQLVRFEQGADGVRAEVLDKKSGETLSVRAQYMIGCDGAASQVRRDLDIEMSGKPKLNYSIGVLFRCPDLLEKTAMGQFERAILVGEEGTWGNLTVIDGKELWRVTIFGSEDRFDIETFDAAHWVRQALGRDDIDFEVLTTVPWRRTELVADHYRSGRVFIAGDSAHTMSPTGGMGVNTGFGDVWDLGWKLRATLAGWAGPGLLDSYEIERRPVALRNAAFSTHNFKTWKTSVDTCEIFLPGPRGDEIRAAIGADLLESTRSDWQSWGIQLGYRYENSPICIPDGTPPTEDSYTDYAPTARPGHRAPHAWLADGRSTIDLFGREFVLLTFPGATAEQVARITSAAAEREIPLRHEAVNDPAIAELYQQPLVLVRPDGHVAWRGASVPEVGEIFDIATGRRRAAAVVNA